MAALSFRPVSPALAPFVARLQYIEASADGALERVLPSGRIHLMVNLHEDEFRTYHDDDCGTVRRTSGAVLEGAPSRARVIDTNLTRSLISVDFTLGGAAAFFRAPLVEARDELVPLDDVWPCDGRQLRNRLLQASSPEMKCRVLEDALLAHFDYRDAPDGAVAAAATLLERGTSIDDAASRIGVSRRTLVRRFQASTGLTPKRFARVRRLQRVVGSVPASHDVDWCDVAAVHGFADQAHLVHDFRELAGISPTAYRPRSVAERNHVPVAPP
jgi:AraC-like DNA-binding protein